MKLVKINKKDWNHFTNICYKCKKLNEDNSMIPVLLDIYGYFEMHYYCVNCVKE